MSLRKSAWALLVLVLISLLAVNIRLSRTDVDISPVVMGALPSSTETAAAADEAVVRDSLQLSQTLARPLFSPTRREFAPETRPIEKQAAPVIATQTASPVVRPAIAFQGTRVIGQQRHALVRLDDAQASEWLPVGGKVADWTIIDIGPHELTLAQKGESVSFSLFEEDGKAKNATNEAGRRQTQPQ